jgi:DNA ligase (NAD+)
MLDRVPTGEHWCSRSDSVTEDHRFEPARPAPSALPFFATLNPPSMNARALLICVVAVIPMLAADWPTPDAREQIAVLRQQIARHDELYHRRAAPEIADADYDRLKQELAALERAFPNAAAATPPLAGIGDDRTGLFQAYRHLVPMMSLDKAYAPEELRAFHARSVKSLGREDLFYVVEPKYDGLAISVTYVQGKLTQAVTRGDGTVGDDITANVRQIPGLPQTLRAGPAIAVPEIIELRGEIYVPFAEFERVNAARALAAEPLFANPRNLAAGTVRQVDARDVSRRGLRIVFFGLGACEPALLRPRTQSEFHVNLKTWGLPTVEKFRTARGLEELMRAVDALQQARETLAFPTDGAVIKLDSFGQQRETGANDVAPRWAVAYKFPPERVETQLRSITLQVGRTGVLTPVAELVPVQLAGSKVARATLHNREEIARKDIRVGDFVYVEKAGEVIPAIAGVNLARRGPEAAPFQFPVACPECYAPLVRSEIDVAVRCPNHSCPAQVRRRLEHFASKACLDIEGLGPAMIGELVGNGWVSDLPDLYRLRRADLLTLGKNNERTVDRLLAAIEKSKRAELWRVIHGLGLPQVGASTAKDLARQCGSLAALAEDGPKAAVVLAAPRYQGLIAELISVGFAPGERTAANPNPNAPLGGKTFVLTGTLPHLTRTQATARIEAAGGTVMTIVSAKTDYAVVGGDAGAKLAQARALGIPILDEAALLAMMGER